MHTSGKSSWNASLPICIQLLLRFSIDLIYGLQQHASRNDCRSFLVRGVSFVNNMFCETWTSSGYYALYISMLFHRHQCMPQHPQCQFLTIILGTEQWCLFMERSELYGTKLFFCVERTVMEWNGLERNRIDTGGSPPYPGHPRHKRESPPQLGSTT